MSRILSQAAIQSMMAQSTPKVWLFLLKLWMPPPRGWAVYFCNDMVDVTSGGQVYTAYPFTVALPPDTNDRPPQVELTIDYVGSFGRDLYKTICTFPQDGPVHVDVSIVLSDTPDTIEAGPFEYVLREVHLDDLTLSGALVYEPIFDEAFPCHTMSPHYFPGIYAPLSVAGPVKGRGAPKYIYPLSPKT